MFRSQAREHNSGVNQRTIFHILKLVQKRLLMSSKLSKR